MQVFYCPETFFHGKKRLIFLKKSKFMKINEKYDAKHFFKPYFYHAMRIASIRRVISLKMTQKFHNEKTIYQKPSPFELGILLYLDMLTIKD
jgi:hypothetical protein